MIESPRNATFKKFLSLTSAKGLKEQGLFLLCGARLIREFLETPHLTIVAEIVPPGFDSVAPSAAQVTLSSALFAQIDTLGTHYNILVLEQPAVSALTAQQIASYQPDGIELVAPLGDPGNLGALIRSCEAFAVPRVILTREAAHPFLPKSVKASAGSVLRVPLARGPALAEFPQSALALDAGGVSIDDFSWPEHGLLLIGEEGQGFGASRYPTRIRIPTRGVESLNVVVAASIALSRLPKR